MYWFWWDIFYESLKWTRITILKLSRDAGVRYGWHVFGSVVVLPKVPPFQEKRLRFMAEPTEKEGTGNERNVKSSMNETFQKLILIRILVIKYFLFQSMKQMAISYDKKCTISNNLSGFILSLGHFVTTNNSTHSWNVLIHQSFKCLVFCVLNKQCPQWSRLIPSKMWIAVHEIDAE